MWLYSPIKWKESKAEKIYINEIIRVNYKCNWSCKFCNVYKTNNYWDKDVSHKEVIYKILELSKKYTLKQRKFLILSFSGWEPTLNKNLISYIKLAKKIWIWTTEIQTNWVLLFKNKNLIKDLTNAWLDEIFLAQHSNIKEINKKLWSNFSINDFTNWVKYVRKNKLYFQIIPKDIDKVSIYLNIVVTKINLPNLYQYIKFLLSIKFIDMIPTRINLEGVKTHKISFWLCQPNWYAELNKKEVLLKFDKKELNEIKKVVKLCEENNILPDFHFTSPPLCVLNYPEYNLEYFRLKKLEKNKKDWEINKWNLESYKWLWKEKKKYNECKMCKYNNYCLGFYKNWIKFVWDEYAKNKVKYFIKEQLW